jgi:DNA-binding response OmpR family regulator
MTTTARTTALRILVVDDEQVIGKGFEVALRGRDYGITFVNDPTQLEDAFEGGARYDIAFVDLVMPKRNGLEVMGWLRDHHEETRVVFMSGLTEDATAQEGLEVGARVFLPKPFTRRELIRIIEETMSA